MEIELVNALLNVGGSGVTIWFLIRLDSRMAERDKQIWALLEWLIRESRFGGDNLPPVG